MHATMFKVVAMVKVVAVVKMIPVVKVVAVIKVVTVIHAVVHAVILAKTHTTISINKFLLLTHFEI